MQQNTNKSVLQKTRTLQSSQEAIRNKAKQLKNKLEEARNNKQVELQKNLKDHMIEHYQNSFQLFKQQMEEEAKGQSYSLELIKQFKFSQIVEFQELVKSAMKNLVRSRGETEEMMDRFKLAYEMALRQLEVEADGKKMEVKTDLAIKRMNKIKEFQNSIYIE